MVHDFSRRFTPECNKSEINGRSVRSGLTVSFGQVARFGLQIVSTPLLARLLTPEDYGLIAMVSVLAGVLGMFQTHGLSEATVQKKQITANQVSTLFWINVAVGFALTVLCIVLAPIVAAFYREPRLCSVIRVWSCTFLISSFSIQHQALLMRQMRFKVLTVVDLGSLIAATFTGLVLAFYGADYWALVGIQVVLTVLRTGGIIACCPWVPGLPVRGSGVRPMLALGGSVIGFGVLNFSTWGADRVIIGRFCSPQALGIYSKAFQLLMLPLRNSVDPLAPVATAALSRLQTDIKGFRSYYCQIVSFLSYLTFPMTVILIALCDEIVYVVLGSQWMDAAPIFRLLAIASFGQALSKTNIWILTSQGRGKRLIMWALYTSPIYIGAFLVGVQNGITGVAASYMLVELILRIPGFLFAFHSTPIQFRDLVSRAFCPLALSLAMGGGMIIARGLLRDASPFQVLAVTMIVGFLVFASALIAWPRSKSEMQKNLATLRLLKA